MRVATARRAARVLAASGLALVAGGFVAGTGFAVDAAVGGAEEAVGPGRARIVIDVDRSRFSVTDLRAHEGTLLEIEVRNHDPIAHELVVGTEAVHRAHEGGTERRHPPRPGEVSVGPGRSGLTFVVLDDPGTVRFACHLPGHVAYGMVGEIVVIPAD